MQKHFAKVCAQNIIVEQQPPFWSWPANGLFVFTHTKNCYKQKREPQAALLVRNYTFFCYYYFENHNHKVQRFDRSIRQTSAEWKAKLKPCWQAVPAARAAEPLLCARCDGALGLAGLPAAHFSSNWGLASGSPGTPGSNKLWVESKFLVFSATEVWGRKSSVGV